MKPTDLLAVLQGMLQDKLALLRQHELAAQAVSSYEFNNAYQQVIGRDQTHVSWLRAAQSGLDVAPNADISVPGVPAPAGGEAGAQALFETDAAAARDFVARWRPRVQAISHARHRKMLDLMLGEIAEHQRFFEMAAAGRSDLLGRRPDTAGTGGGVLSTRWLG